MQFVGCFSHITIHISVYRMQVAAKNEKDLSDIWIYNFQNSDINKIILFFSSWTHVLLFIFYSHAAIVDENVHSINCRLMKVVPINVLVLPVMQEMEINILANLIKIKNITCT